MSNDKVIEAVEEASISVACLLDVVHGEELQKRCRAYPRSTVFNRKLFEGATDE